MSALYILVLASLVVAALFLFAFIWSVRNDQFDDKEGASLRMLYDNNSNEHLMNNLKDSK